MIRFPKGRGNCRQCGAPRYREGLCREHLFAKRRREYDAKRKITAQQCKNCGGEFKTARSTQKFCSLKCANAERWKLERKGEFKTLPCRNCHTLFTQRRSNQRYCSPRCGEMGAKPLQRKLRITKGMIDAACEQCGEKFKHKARSSERKARFCSTKCFYIANSSTRSPLKRDGKFDVPARKLWASLCRTVRERDYHRCSACSADKEGKRQHPVDHIFPRRLVSKWGNDPHQLCNLTTLCRVCHGKKGMAENKILRGDVVGFLAGLRAMNYPMDRVQVACIEFGIRMAA